ncbi:DNA-binding response regulator [Paenibacillus sambharensis]|uniref:DNA-binding response regulator n=1 Tax=Paenibacillus sambharensis TaxID=1803190 RepID=A0A2W1LAY2_9BACL|nr:response regulator [Paenibacillus sambharensis]PZD95290.1 DNA-binding response regulator [Paenibacillus sambharensis]
MLQILLVDDEQYVVDDLEIAFPWEEYGISRVHKAYSGSQAIQIMENFPIDILLSDIAMPGMSGLELVGYARNSNPRIKCILLTGYSDFEYAVEALKNGVMEYLVKPLDQNKLRLALQTAAEAINEELLQSASYDQAVLAYREHLPLVKDRLLYEIIQGKKFRTEYLNKKLADYRIPIRDQDTVYLLVVRLEEHFTSYDADSQLLYEYAVANIAEEILGEDFAVWHCRDAYEYLVFILKHTGEDLQQDEQAVLDKLKGHADQLHYKVNEYLKGGITVILSSSGMFVRDVRSMYEETLSALRQQAGVHNGYFLSVADKPANIPVQPLRMLYEPPTFIHLLETGQWAGFKERLERVKQVCEGLPGHNEEYFEEIRSVLLAAFHYIAHKNRELLSDLVGHELLNKPSFRSLAQLVGWGQGIADILKDKLEHDTKSNQQRIVQEICNFIDQRYAEASLQSIADYAALHPSHVSRLFKQVSGISISEYIHHVKMERAVTQLRETESKIYEISDKLGYSNSQYFIKVFKEQFGMTPQEYREKQQARS